MIIKTSTKMSSRDKVIHILFLRKFCFGIVEWRPRTKWSWFPIKVLVLDSFILQNFCTIILWQYVLITLTPGSMLSTIFFTKFYSNVNKLAHFGKLKNIFYLWNAPTFLLRNENFPKKICCLHWPQIIIKNNEMLISCFA